SAAPATNIEANAIPAPAITFFKPWFMGYPRSGSAVIGVPASPGAVPALTTDLTRTVPAYPTNAFAAFSCEWDRMDD
ncbi:MAG: hypothetical protein FD119_3240, partial [Stygiobacter sp.]